jgi:pimeloyl-ACP methyl ester carboxylesterase
VKCIGGIYPVVNADASRLQPRIAEAYGLPEPAFAQILNDNNPIERLQALAAHGIPIFHVHGDADEIVPLESNSAELVRRYKALGGSARLLTVTGKGHEEVREFFECPELVDFFVANA